MKKHTKKMIAPIIAAAIFVVYYIAFAVLCISAGGFSAVVMLIGIIVPLALACVCVAMLIERIKEIKGGQEDDLGNY